MRGAVQRIPQKARDRAGVREDSSVNTAHQPERDQASRSRIPRAAVRIRIGYAVLRARRVLRSSNVDSRATAPIGLVSQRRGRSRSAPPRLLASG